MRIGVDSAPGHAVLFTDTESRVSDDWFDAATAALTSGAQLIGGPVVTNPSGLRRPVDAAGFALDYGRHATPPFLNAEGHPSANNFGAARALLDAAPSGDLWKSQLCSWAQGHGVETSPVTAMLVTSTKRYTPGSLVLDQLQRGRIHGALRRPTLGIFARLARIIGAPGVPLIAALRLRGSMPSGRRRARTWSITLFGLCGWAIGEAIGYAAGPAPTSRGFG